jgi:hypothetical protein
MYLPGGAMRLINILALLLLVGLIFVIWQLVDVRQVRTAQLPEYDVDVGRIEIGERPQTVELPTLQMEEREVNLPSISVEKPPEETPPQQ